jgi:hypothetical protein
MARIKIMARNVDFGFVKVTYGYVKKAETIFMTLPLNFK